MSEQHLCVGGPHGGKRVASRSDIFKCVDRSPTDVLTMMRCGHDTPSMEIKTVEYRRQRFEYGDGTSIIVWAPMGQTVKRTMEILLETYEWSKK